MMTPGKNDMLTKIEGPHLSYLLPSPMKKGKMSVEEALSDRRSRRHYLDKEITAENLSQVLWASYGLTSPGDDYSFFGGGLRTTPAAGARYSLEIYVLAGKVAGIEQGVYRYVSREHTIVRTIERDLREDLCTAALSQEMIAEAPAVLVYSAVYRRNTERYGSRGRKRYVCMEAGHSAQNVYLQAEALHLGTCAIGAFYDERVKKVLQLPPEEEPLYIMPVGYCST